MRKPLSLMLLTTLVLAGAGLAGDKDHVKWVKSYSDGIKAAKEAKKPIFIDFMTTW